MNISLCSFLFDYSGNFFVKADLDDSDFSYVARRVSRTATLDGGASIVDNGYSPSDAIFMIILKNINEATRLDILQVLKLHSRVIISCKNGCFKGVVESVYDKEKMKIKFLVETQLNG